MKARHKRARRQQRRVNRAKLGRQLETMAHFRETPADMVVGYDELIAFAAVETKTNAGASSAPGGMGPSRPCSRCGSWLVACLCYPVGQVLQ